MPVRQNGLSDDGHCLEECQGSLPQAGFPPTLLVQSASGGRTQAWWTAPNVSSSVSSLRHRRCGNTTSRAVPLWPRRHRLPANSRHSHARLSTAPPQCSLVRCLLPIGNVLIITLFSEAQTRALPLQIDRRMAVAARPSEPAVRAVRSRGRSAVDQRPDAARRRQRGSDQQGTARFGSSLVRHRDASIAALERDRRYEAHRAAKSELATGAACNRRSRSARFHGQHRRVRTRSQLLGVAAFGIDCGRAAGQHVWQNGLGLAAALAARLRSNGNTGSALRNSASDVVGSARACGATDPSEHADGLRGCLIAATSGTRPDSHVDAQLGFVRAATAWHWNSDWRTLRRRNRL